MVRIKHRYLLVSILYPDFSDAFPAKDAASAKEAVPDIVQFNQPTPEYLTPQLVIRSIRDQIEENFGEYGAGVAANGLKGYSKRSHLFNPPPLAYRARCSQLPFPRNLNSDHSLLA